MYMDNWALKTHIWLPLLQAGQNTEPRSVIPTDRLNLSQSLKGVFRLSMLSLPLWTSCLRSFLPFEWFQRSEAKNTNCCHPLFVYQRTLILVSNHGALTLSLNKATWLPDTPAMFSWGQSPVGSWRRQSRPMPRWIASESSFELGDSISNRLECTCFQSIKKQSPCCTSEAKCGAGNSTQHRTACWHLLTQCFLHHKGEFPASQIQAKTSLLTLGCHERQQSPRSLHNGASRIASLHPRIVNSLPNVWEVHCVLVKSWASVELIPGCVLPVKAAGEIFTPTTIGVLLSWRSPNHSHCPHEIMQVCIESARSTQNMELLELSFSEIYPLQWILVNPPKHSSESACNNQSIAEEAPSKNLTHFWMAAHDLGRPAHSRPISAENSWQRFQKRDPGPVKKLNANNHRRHRRHSRHGQLPSEGLRCQTNSHR